MNKIKNVSTLTIYLSFDGFIVVENYNWFVVYLKLFFVG